MTKQDFTKEIRIPIWVVTAAIVIAMALLGFMWKQAIVQGQIVEQVRQIRTDLDMHVVVTRSAIQQRVERREFDRLCLQLDRIEEYLRNHK